jgi:hypothetical protein
MRLMFAESPRLTDCVNDESRIDLRARSGLARRTSGPDG